jgi:hypothetical protein
MAMRVYCDGSGKTTNRKEKLLILTGVAASENVWPLFECRWKETLDHHGVPYLHMKKAMPRKGVYSGWDEIKLNAFLGDFMLVLGNFVNKGLRVYPCCVVIEDYRKAQKEIPALKKKKIEAFCVDNCVGRLQPTVEDLEGDRPIRIYFDQCEQFIRTMLRVWERAEEKGATGWPKQVKCIKEVNMRDAYGVQAADFVAWIVRRHYTCGDEDGLYTFSSLIKHSRWFYDYDSLKEEYREKV